MKKELLILLENKEGERYGLYNLPKNPTPYCCWRVGNENFNKNNTFWGHYFVKYENALKDLFKRTGKDFTVIKNNNNEDLKKQISVLKEK